MHYDIRIFTTILVVPYIPSRSPSSIPYVWPRCQYTIIPQRNDPGQTLSACEFHWQEMGAHIHYFSHIRRRILRILPSFLQYKLRWSILGMDTASGDLRLPSRIL